MSTHRLGDSATPVTWHACVWRFSSVLARSAVMGLVLVFALVACGDDSGTEAPVFEAVLIDDADPSPLELAVGFSSDRSRRNQQFVMMQRRANESVTQCMAEAGFDYWVEPVSPAFLLGPRSGDGSLGWVEVNGLGITTSLIELTRPAPVRVVLDAAAANDAYTSSLSAEEAAAYDQALIGETDPAPSGFAPDGCWSRAFVPVLARLGVLDRFGAELDGLQARIDADPRVATLMSTWRDCMAGRGRAVTDRQAMVDDLFAALLAVEYVEVDGQLGFADPGLVDQLLAAEIAVAVDDYECRTTIDVDLDDVRADYEREFLLDNRTDIESLISTTD